MSAMSYDPAAYAVVAAMHDAAYAALAKSRVASAVVATIIKLVGKAHGTLTVAMAAARQGVWNAALAEIGSPHIIDAKLRFEDALAAANMTKLLVVSQLHVEDEIVRKQRHKSIPDTMPPNSFVVMENAARRWLDYIGCRTELQEFIAWTLTELTN